MIAKVMQCKDADELIALAKSEGHEMTKEEAEAYLAELEDFELDSDELKNVAGGICWSEACVKDCLDYGTAGDLLW
jgi:predicted ribosomally synthesized peptide with nif11-like leader